VGRTDVATGLFGSAACTIETWVYIPSAATMGRTALVSTMSESTSSAAIALMLGLESGGQLVIQTSAALLTGPVLARDTWFHVVGSVGAAGLKLRINKVTEALNAAQTSTSATAYSVFQRREKNATGTGDDWRTGTQVRLGPTSIYASQLSDARADAHYDAAFASVEESIKSAAVRVETMFSAQKVRAAAHRLGVLLLEYVPIRVASTRVSAVVDGSPWVRVSETHIELLIQERVPLQTVRDILVPIKREDGRWEQPWYHWSDSDGV
jgi:hypothetical protein